MYTNAQYIGNPAICIRCDINGMTSFVPLDPANTDYANLMKLVEDNKLTIAPAATANTGK